MALSSWSIGWTVARCCGAGGSESEGDVTVCSGGSDNEVVGMRCCSWLDGSSVLEDGCSFPLLRKPLLVLCHLVQQKFKVTGKMVANFRNSNVVANTLKRQLS